jgi:arylsulfatase A-like enzyme
MTAIRRARATVVLLTAVACARAPESPPSLLVIVLDDVGTDAVGTWGEHPDAPPTPTIDALAAEGVLFRNAWSTPACAPTRATIMTGRHGRRTGIGSGLPPWTSPWGLQLDEVTLAEAVDLGPVDHATVATGKWHLSAPSVGGPRHPLEQGFDHFDGSLGNLLPNQASDRGPQAYDDWERDVDGVMGRSHTWAPTVAIDAALAAIREAEGPWLAYVALQAAHTPYQAPPPELLDEPVPEDADDVTLFRAMVRAADREIGRLLAEVDLATTTVVLLGDNGTPPEVTTPPFVPALAKETVAEGGVGIPFLIAGAGVEAPGAETPVPVHTTDILPTLAELAQVDPAALPVLDGISLVPWMVDPATPAAREAIYTEWFLPDGRGPYEAWQAAVRDERWKLARDQHGTELFFDLQGVHEEAEDLLRRSSLDAEQQAALSRLRAFLDAKDAELGAR